MGRAGKRSGQRALPLRRVALATLAAGLAAGALGAWRARGGEVSAREIVERNVAARGGYEAWRRVETMAWTGHVESARTPSPSMPFRMDQKRPSKTRMQIEAPGYRSVRVFDGGRGWKLHPGVGGQAVVQPFSPPEVTYALAGPGIDGPLLHHAASGRPVSLVSVDELGKRKAYHLRISLPRGDEDIWVDAETYLELRHDRPAEGPGSRSRQVSATYGDYRTVDGLKLPFLIETGTGSGAVPDRMVIERVTLNAPIGDATFGNPSAPRPGRRGLPGAAAQTLSPAAASEAREPAPP